MNSTIDMEKFVIEYEYEQAQYVLTFWLVVVINQDTLPLWTDPDSIDPELIGISHLELHPGFLDFVYVLSRPWRKYFESDAPEESAIWVSLLQDFIGWHVLLEITRCLHLIPNILDCEFRRIHIKPFVSDLVILQQRLGVLQDFLQEWQTAVLIIGKPPII